LQQAATAFGGIRVRVHSAGIGQGLTPKAGKARGRWRIKARAAGTIRGEIASDLVKLKAARQLREVTPKALADTADDPPRCRITAMMPILSRSDGPTGNLDQSQ
jgi:hypothetical protein